MAKNNKRVATVLRKTAETDIALTLTIDGRGRSEIATGVPFFDHMLTLFAKHGLFDLKVKAKGDVEVDYHHTVEDVGLVLRGSHHAHALHSPYWWIRCAGGVNNADRLLARRYHDGAVK